MLRVANPRLPPQRGAKTWDFDRLPAGPGAFGHTLRAAGRRGQFGAFFEVSEKSAN
jgi:hypothetical protein